MHTSGFTFMAANPTEGIAVSVVCDSAVFLFVCMPSVCLLCHAENWGGNAQNRPSEQVIKLFLNGQLRMTDKVQYL